jgi:putative hydrolase of the HAD superfamily
MSRNTLLIFDADNTIWDTNSVYLEAQLAMLRPFQINGYIKDHTKEIISLRSIDQSLAKKISNFEYNPLFLAKALTFYYVSKVALDESVNMALQDTNSVVNASDITIASYKNYISYISKIPALLKGVKDFFIQLNSQNKVNIATILYSEGEISRINSVFQSHSFESLSPFDEIVVNSKNSENFIKAKQIGLKYLPTDGEIQTIVIGDSLKRDIIPANYAGFVTIYIPAAYQGVEQYTLPFEKPDFQIDSFHDLSQTLRLLGIDI